MTDPLGTLKKALRCGHPTAQPGPFPRLARESGPSTYAVHRFLHAWSQVPALGPDHAVLLRQVLEWSGVPSLALGAHAALAPPSAETLAKAGIEWTTANEIILHPYRPAWLPCQDTLTAPPHERAPDETFPAEAYLQSVGFPRWRSPAQKEAAWVALHTPEGATRIFVMPTGSGKSLCFQLLPRFFSGLTVVVVPTIALAMDQQANAAKLLANLPGVNPVYFASDDAPEATQKAVADQRTRLLFTSPEACVSGRLRPILDNFAAKRWLRNLVVDEAHLIETWGAQFRVEFQLLAAARRRWREASEGSLRTFLFSATMTPRCRESLQKMFSDGDAPSEFVSQRLRPEVRYYSHRFSDDAPRDEAVIEALWHLPRPAILYVTEKAAAERFAARLRTEGFLRIGCFHGDTRRKDRRRLLSSWKQNDLDLMVATSAFGVGVDKPDVRSVIHACHPENLDRYYQEVGRGGRDGWSSISLLLPAAHDRVVADNITVQLMRPERLQQRWSAMFNAAEDRGDCIYALNVAMRRAGLLGARTYRENIRWNKRLLLQLERAGLLQILDLEYRDPVSPEDDPEEWVVVKVNFAPHTPRLGERIAPQREEELRHFHSGLDKLDEFLAGSRCAARVIGKLYDFASHQRACPGCFYCSTHHLLPPPSEPLDFPPAPPWQPPLRSEMVESCPSPLARSGRPDFIDLVSRCVTVKGLRQFYCPAGQFDAVLSCFAEAFPSNTATLHRLDALTDGSKVSAAATFPLALLHIGRISAPALDLARPFPSVHFLCDVRHPCDSNGRHVASNEGLPLWASPESWIAESAEISMPCSPTTL